jgi:four helix bundle protein
VNDFSREEMMSVAGLKKLDVWRKSKDFALLIYREMIPLLPMTEKFVMIPQIKRSAQSIPANLAEGHGRFYYQENVRFCYIARGSLEETMSYIVFAHDLEYLPNDVYQKLCIAGEDLTRVINGYIAYLKKARLGQNEPGNYSVHEPQPDYMIDLLRDEQPITNNE